MKRRSVWLATSGLVALMAVTGFYSAYSARAQAPPSVGARVHLTGEVIETWCSVSAIMYAYGTAHHQCAAWCAAGGIPVGLKDTDGNYYMILKLEDEASNVANPRMAAFQSHEVTVDGDLIERDGVKYLIVGKVVDDKGVVNRTHEQYGITPVGY